MDISCFRATTLHPQAKDFLFQHYRTLKRVFNDVLGQLEIDYIGIALLNQQNQWLFLSSRPGIEQNLIEHDVWFLDPCFQPKFFVDNKAYIWCELYSEKVKKHLRHYKLSSPKFSFGLSVPALFDKYRVTYSFALISNDKSAHHRILNKIDTLICIGRFCLQNIMQIIPIPGQEHVFVVKKPNLKLIVNNEVHHENVT